jgi:hypothetical protein
MRIVAWTQAGSRMEVSSFMIVAKPLLRSLTQMGAFTGSVNWSFKLV